jgi:hypothetical protein
MASSHENSPSSLWERIVHWATAIAEAAEMDTFGYLVGRIDHLERRIATLESSDRGAASPKANEIEPWRCQPSSDGSRQRTGGACRYQNR